MERNANGSQNLRKNHGKRWRSEANSSCSLCEDNMERVKEMFPCNHKGFLRKQVKQEEDDDDHLYSKRTKLKKRYKSKFEESKNEAPKVQPIIEQITGPGESKISEDSSESGSLLLNEMMQKFNMHTTDSSLSSIDKIETWSEPDEKSYFEYDKS